VGELTWSEQERRRLVRLCAVLTGDPAAADDLAHEVASERPDGLPVAQPEGRDELGEWLEREELAELVDSACSSWSSA
jgi:DNA-directed RNA polymerase specialized sigma24 family protein